MAGGLFRYFQFKRWPDGFSGISGLNDGWNDFPLFPLFLACDVKFNTFWL
jgi:hypothetical protein